MARSSHESPQGGVRSETLVAALTLIFEDTEGLDAEGAVRRVLAEREAISLVSEAVPWDGLVLIEVGIAVDPEGLILLANADGSTRLGQQVEDFALALKLGTGALYADQDDYEVQSGEPIQDERLGQMPPGRTLLAGALTEADMQLLAAASKTEWNLLLSEDPERTSIAVHDGFLVGGYPGADQYPAVMISRCGPRYTASFWFPQQSSKLSGEPAWVHIWPVAAGPAVQPAAGTAARAQLQLLETHYFATDPAELDELSSMKVSGEHIEILKRVLTGAGGQQAAEQVLAAFGHDPNAARYLSQASLPEGSRLIQPMGFGKALGRAVAMEARKSSAAPRWFNSMSWKPWLQLCWGLIEALVFTLMLAGTDWDRPWVAAWLVVVILAVGYVDAAGNVVFGAVRWVRGMRRR
ncbi:hypothetical protein ACPROK_16410 [Glutamicibacter soli]|uniref:hypothetical protein n=1 Tax=Glutamicibacter soli TaxID=453836 RepID=UPI003C70BA24